MNYILNIDTAENRASVCLSVNGNTLSVIYNDSRNDHASWLHPAVQSLLSANGIGVKDLAAVAVGIGPGSYTGLRVALSAAKGFCYALSIPLITVSTLEMAAQAAIEEAVDLICPMIDARRMEVFTGVYDTQLKEIMAPHALILENNSLSALINGNNVLFCGSGSDKLLTLFPDTTLTVSKTRADASHLAVLATRKFQSGSFADTAYTEPLYLKEYYSTERKKP